MKNELIKYFKSLGLKVNTNTKARGHQGFFVDNRIDISKETEESRVVPTLLHEFAHFIHKKLEPEMAKTGGSLAVLFNLDIGLDYEKNKKVDHANKINPIESFFSNFLKKPSKPEKSSDNENMQLKINDSQIKKIKSELLAVTNLVDKNSHLTKLHEHKDIVKSKIKILEAEIKADYPKFLRSKKFKEFDKYIKKSNAKYLLKYDRLKFITPFLGREQYYSIDTVEMDFPDMPNAFCSYIKLKSCVRKQARISKRLNRLNKYYSKPTELFARFVEGLYIDEVQTRAVAPISTEMFFKLLDDDYYFELKNVFEILQKDLVCL